MATVLETMTRYRYAKYTVRVWRDCTPPPPFINAFTAFTMGPDPEVEAKCRWIEKEGLAGNPPAIAFSLFELPRVNAVEVLDPDGNGGLVYPEWP